MIRPMTSGVSALSGIVANGHQAIHFVSSAPSKIPYGGFSPVRAPNGLSAADLRGASHLYAATVEVSSVSVVFRSRTCVRRHSRLLTPLARPVALGSASGYSVSQPHRLLWPHPSFCAAPLALCLISSGSEAAQKVPTFIRQSLLTCRRPYSDGSSDRARIQTTGLAFTHLAEVRQPYLSTHQTTCGGFNEAATFGFMLRPVSLLAPLWTGTFTAELALGQIAPAIRRL